MDSIQQAGTIFDTLRRTRGETEYWSARELLPALGYQRWENAQAALTRAMDACEGSDQASGTHFRAATKKVSLGGKASRDVLDYHLSRYGAYLTAMNSDPSKGEVALAQTYFATQTRRAEVAQARTLALPDDPVLAQLALLAEVRREQLHTRAEVASIRQELDLSPVVGGQLRIIYDLGQRLGQLMGDYRRAWRLFKDRFGLASYRDLPRSQFDEGVRFLQLQISAYTGQPLLDGGP